MGELKHDNDTLFWEEPSIDLSLRHYSGSPSDVIKRIKADIENYLSTPNLHENYTSLRPTEDGGLKVVNYNIREIYSAIYNALNYYKDISYLPSAEFGTGDTFLSNCIRTFNEDYEYLAAKYNSPDPMVPPVISASARIKSPLSFVEKVREKVTEYIEEGVDLAYLNESLRDIIGMRFVIDPPQEIQALGPQAECDYLYRVYYDLMERHGVTRQTDSSNPNDFQFINVNTRHDPNKAEKMKTRAEKYGFADYLKNPHSSFFIPERRIPEVEQECVDSVLKDYCFNPKFKGYQSLHTCVIPPYSKAVEHMEIPPCIATPSCMYSVFEYQFRTAKQNEFAERGPASHNLEYKPTGSYHRLSVPFYITFDSLEDISEDLYDPSKSPKGPLNYKNKLRLRNFGESFKKYYGYTFESYFGIPFKKFRDTFGARDRDDILARKKHVVYDENKNIYRAVVNEGTENPVIITLTKEELLTLRELLSSKSPLLTSFFETAHLTDNMINVLEITPGKTPSTEHSTVPKTAKSGMFQIYTVETCQDRERLAEEPKVLKRVPITQKPTIKNTEHTLDD